MAKSDNVTVTNISRQLISLQIKHPKGDFFRDERQARLMPGKSITVPRDHLLWPQVKNCQANRMLQVHEEMK